MAKSARTFRVFVSSTFSDLKAERDALQARVFPRLRELAEAHGCRFQAIDLRWGVSDEAALDQQAMKICLGEIERCQRVSPRPNFIVLLGDRYGWRPPPAQIPAAEFQQILGTLSGAEKALLETWYSLDANAVPPEWRLKPRAKGGPYEPYAGWQPLEVRLQRILGDAAARLGFTGDRLLSYTASATEQEIAAGALRVEDAPEHVFCFFRRIEGLPRGYDPAAGDFLDLDESDQSVDQEAHDRQAALKQRLAAFLPKRNLSTYPARWTGDGITTGHLDLLCADVYAALEGIILAEIEKPHEPVSVAAGKAHLRAEDVLDDEGRLHRDFAEERLRFFVGRSEMLDRIAGYLQDSRCRCLGIAGGGGTGKSALIARAVEAAQSAYPNAAIVYRFIGATPASSDGRSLLESLCHEISRRYGAKTTSLPIDYRDLVPELGKRMALATAEKPLILFLDSLDQLSPSQGARSLVWLPNELPEQVSVVISTREEDTWKNLQSKSPRQAALSGLSRVDGEALLALWLADIHRTLQPSQRADVLASFEACQGNPLYLKLAFEEARLWSSFQPQERLAASLGGLIQHNMFERLEKEGSHGDALVSHALGYLAASRYGLAEDELVDLLSRDPQVYGWFYRKSYHLPADLIQAAVQYLKSGAAGNDEQQAAIAWLDAIRAQPDQVSAFLGQVLPRADGPRLPVVLWSRLSFDLAPYLGERALDGSPLLNFFHRELGEVAREVFLADGNQKTYHARLADYFRFKADPAASRTWNGRSTHGLSELPYHLTLAERLDEAYQVLTDFKFLEHKAAEVGVLARRDEEGNPANTYTGVLQLLEDYQRALAAMPGGGGGWGDRAALILTALETSQGLMFYCPVCNHRSPIQREQLGTGIACPQESCRAPIKLNLFTVRREI